MRYIILIFCLSFCSFRFGTVLACLASYASLIDARSIYVACASLIIIVLESMLQYLAIINILDRHRVDYSRIRNYCVQYACLL